MPSQRKLVDVTQDHVYAIRDVVRRALSTLHDLQQGLEAVAIGSELALRRLKEAQTELAVIT